MYVPISFGFIALLSFITIGNSEVHDVDKLQKSKLPTIEIVVLVHPFNKVKTLPFLLGGIEQQNYPKSRINVYFRTENILSDRDPSIVDANELTIQLLEKWTKNYMNVYHQITLDVFPIVNVEEEETEYWSKIRFKTIIAAKESSLIRARRNWVDFVLFLDADAILTNSNVFKTFTTASGDAIVSAPMLYSLGTYSNFWAGMTDKGYYKRTDDYLEILDRRQTGDFIVPMVHSCFFIDLRKSISDHLSFVPKATYPFDDIISFAFTAQSLGINFHVDNEEIWGYLMPLVDSGQNQNFTQDLIDLELESLVEGTRFPIAHGFNDYVRYQPTDKLGVDNIYLINLIRRPERLQRMQNSLKVIGIEAQIWPATDGKDLSDSGLRNLGIKLIPGYLDPYHSRPMTYGEIGCFLSHFFIWQDIVNRNFSSAIVLEDDVRFERNMKQRFVDAIGEINPDEVDFVYIGRKKQGSDNEVRITLNLVKPTYSYWTIGYFITNKGAHKLLKAKPKERLLPVDEFLPIMYDEHTNETLKSYYPKRNLIALSFQPVLITPTHYVGDDMYVSDTEASANIQSLNHPKHNEL